MYEAYEIFERVPHCFYRVTLWSGLDLTTYENQVHHFILLLRFVRSKRPRPALPLNYPFYCCALPSNLQLPISLLRQALWIISYIENVYTYPPRVKLCSGIHFSAIGWFNDNAERDILRNVFVKHWKCKSLESCRTADLGFWKTLYYNFSNRYLSSFSCDHLWRTIIQFNYALWLV